MNAAPSPVRPIKIAILAMHDALEATQEGKAATAQMSAKYEPRRAQLEKEQAAIAALEDRWNKGAAAMSAESLDKLKDEIEERKRKFQFDAGELNAAAQKDDNRLAKDLTGKMSAILDQYAKENGYTVVIDASVADALRPLGLTLQSDDLLGEILTVPVARIGALLPLLMMVLILLFRPRGLMGTRDT